MSLDLSFVDADGHDLENFNITHNLAKMARAAGLYDVLWGAYDLPAHEMIEPLCRGISFMHQNEEELRAKYDPPNLWGDFTGLSNFAGRILLFCLKNPGAKAFGHG